MPKKTAKKPGKSRIITVVKTTTALAIILATALVFALNRPYQFGRDALMCDPNETRWSHKRFCDTRGNEITGQIRVDKKDGLHEIWRVENGRPLYVNSFWPNGRIRARYREDGIFRTLREYDDTGALVTEGFIAETGVSRTRRTIYHRTDQDGPVTADYGPRHDMALYSLNDGSLISGRLRIYNSAGDLWRVVRLEDGIINNGRRRTITPNQTVTERFEGGELRAHRITYNTPTWSYLWGTRVEFDELRRHYFGEHIKLVHLLQGHPTFVMCGFGGERWTTDELEVLDGEIPRCPFED